jgi:23S rRNA pseudouridine2604 synthase
MAHLVFQMRLMTTPIRLSKRLVELVSCSRREAEIFILSGWVKVGGVVVEEPQFMVGEQKKCTTRIKHK